MCSPLLAAAGAAEVGGSLLNAQGAAGNQKAAINASNTDNLALAAKEKGLQDQSSGIFNQTLAPYQGAVPGQTLSADQSKNTTTLAGNGPTAAQLAGGGVTNNAPQVVQDTERATIANRMKQLGTSDANLGALGGYTTQNQDSGRALRSGADQIGTIGNFATEDANVGAAKRQADITNSQKPISPFGDLLKGAGLIASLGAGAGLFGAGAAPGVIGANGANAAGWGGAGFTPNIGGTGLLY